MQFDSADLLRIETDGSLENVTFYEMGHLLGVALSRKTWVCFRVNPVFTGSNAMREFGALIGSDEPTPAPVENKGDRHPRRPLARRGLVTN
jgi:hypothetical protein